MSRLLLTDPVTAAFMEFLVDYIPFPERSEPATRISLIDTITDPELRRQAEDFILSCRSPDDLTAGQRLALLIVAKTELAKLCVETLRKSTARTCAKDYDELVRMQWARRDRKGYHIITPIGRFRADALAKTTAKELGLHFFLTSGSRFQTTVRCTCGWGYHHSRNEGHERSAFGRRMGEHLREVGADKASIVAGAS